MVPEDKKFYEIDFKSEDEDDEGSYKGIARYVGRSCFSLEMLYLFEIPNDVINVWFAEGDIVSLSTESFEPLTTLNYDDEE
jgi:hypothetical protein